VQTKIEKIGDGFGLLLPKELLEACGLGDEVTVTVQNSTLIVSPGPQKARQGWAEALQAIPQAEWWICSAVPRVMPVRWC